nr:MAG TPA: hypothetical protein [Caudoviricetes sp.]DAX51306.1 MAG TPA: hypothetical protein [Caudoviricetes sp.]
MQVEIGSIWCYQLATQKMLDCESNRSRCR